MNGSALNLKAMKDQTIPTTVQIALDERSYPIVIGAGLLGHATTYAVVPPAATALIVTNTTVAPLYEAKLRQALTGRYKQIHTVRLPDGEAYKDWATLNQIFDALLGQGADRKTVLFALGGGVVGDMTGFAAASYMRGVPFVQIPTTLLAALARRHVKVSLSGDGGDELFGGYERYPMAERTWRKLTRIPRPVRGVAHRVVTSVSPERWNLALKPTGLHRRGVTGDRLHKLAELFDAHSSMEFYRDLVSTWRRPTRVVRGSSEPQTELMTLFAGGRGGFLAEMMLHDQVSYLPDDILVKVDRAAMAASLESRAPLLDHRLAEFSWRLPAHNWRRNGEGKWIVRQVLDRYVPRALVDRPKQGFGVPLSEWLRGPLRDWADDLLAPSELARDGLFDVAPIATAWSEHRSGTRNWAPSLWSVLMFQAWRIT